jgi:ketosteroid isomerase-like protein
MSNPNADLIHQFYTAFQQKDAAGMKACYGKDLVFNDPVFQNLSYIEANKMWEMLLRRGKDLELTFDNVRPTPTGCSADWEATYTFSQTGRKVVNRIHAQFEIMDGKITRHTDSFDFYKWARQAFGL